MTERSEFKKSLAQVQAAADIWWDLFTMFLDEISLSDAPREAVKKAASLADHALEEYEERWAKKLRDAQELLKASCRRRA